MLERRRRAYACAYADESPVVEVEVEVAVEEQEVQGPAREGACHGGGGARRSVGGRKWIRIEWRSAGHRIMTWMDPIRRCSFVRTR